ncbi:cell adhesion molecule DSCAM-like isoform X3 [Mercenaria mercenaria]|uniref:cell adhesion molecule DSCAM-like isoform X3 n=1 Tax=Mercenaria mercenaria TaxID=6596 RepID=UPI00234F4FE4|nr:cell adhesion molecule DSCAM-like isoform X3 [Mercenaria mercenaria]
MYRIVLNTRPVIFCGTLVFLSIFKAIAGSTTESPDDGLRGPIFLSEPPTSVVIPNTKGAIIPCGVYGNPAPLVTWITGNGDEIGTQPGVVEVLHNQSLYFQPFDEANVVPAIHTQEYRCVARNRIGQVISRKVHTVAVIVEQLERFTVHVHDVWVMRGGTAVFKCEINPPFWKDYVNITSWTQGTVHITPGDRISITSEGELHVRDVRDTDGYTDFRCMGFSYVTDDEKPSPPAKLVIHDPPAGGRSPSIDGYPIQDTVVGVGKNVQLPCVADGWPLPTYRWYKNGEALDIQNEERYSQFGGQLVIAPTKLSDGGEYRCNASNSRGSAAAIRTLIVKVPLTVAISPGNQVVDSGKPATFNCSILGFPVTNVLWFKDGHPLLPDDLHVFKSATLLEITVVRRQDQGMYQCFALDGDVETQATAQLLLGAAKPTIIDGFASQYVQKGQRSSVRCIASGNPTPAIKWYLDGEILRESSYLRLGSFVTAAGDVVSYVNISSVTLLAGGDYRCVATNVVGEAEHTSRMNVYGEPYIRTMRNVTATANEKLFIKCYVTGYPIKSVSWYRDSRRLPLNHLQQVVNGTLTILKVQRYDAGKYTCEAVNSAGKGTQESVFVTVVEPPVIDPFRIPPRKQGDRVTLSCAVSSGDLPIYINWTKDGLPIPPDIGVLVETSGSYSSLLKIGDVSPVHDGNYTCHAHNAAASTNFTAFLHVDVPPRWVVEPEDTFVIRQKSVFLDCHATGIPEPRITWSENKGGFPPKYAALDLNRTDHYRVFENGTLQIISAAEDDDGHYLCTADNQIGHGISKIIYLKVHVPARFDSSQKNFTVLRGHNITMDCQAIGDKPISVSWNFNNQTMGSGNLGSRYTVNAPNTDRGKLSQLSIHPAQRGDTGIFTCTAANQFGYDSTAIYLTVLEPPDAPGNLTLIKKGSRYVVLVWTRPFDGNSPLIEYVIEYQNTTGEKRSAVRNVSVDAEALTATVDNLHPSFLYNIRIRARNAVGLGLTSHQVSTKMLEEPPNGPPVDVEVTALGSQKLKVSWKPPALDHRNGVILGYYIGYQETNVASQRQVISKDIDPDKDGPEDEVSVVISNLKKFTEYLVHVKSYNKEGPGPASTDIKVMTLEDVPSQPPEGVRAYAITSQAINVAWKAPSLFALHGVLQGYKVLFKPVRKDEDETDSNIKLSRGVDVTLDGLEKFTNYSIEVLAYTRKGEGVRSSPIYVRTLEDVPGRPRGIKAWSVSNTSVIVSWQNPDSPNGILTAFSVYYSNTSASAQEMKIDVPPDQSAYVLHGLEPGVNYWVRVTANTRMGEGESTQIVTVMPVINAPARISSFSEEVVVSWQATVMLSCVVVGDPDPEVTWSTRYGVLENNDKLSILQNGSLFLIAVIGSDADNYTCRAENEHGSDVITYSLSVQVDANSKSPPRAPILSLAAVTSSTVQVNWLSASNGGSPILEFLLRYRKEHDVWQEVTLGPKNRTYTSSGLLCGTSYKYTITAINSIGKSESSNVIEEKTIGSPPIAPLQDEILKSVNVTSVELDLRTWRRDVCPIKFFSIRYQKLGNKQWVEVANNVNWNTTMVPVEDLHPASRYIMLVTAYSDAGSSECALKFSTLTYSGSTLEPLFVVHKNETYFYEKVYIMVPLCAALVVSIALSIGVALFCVRRRHVMRYKETSSNIRRDITAETSLMNDLDKRNINYELESPQDTRFNCRNVNLLISLTSDENLSGNNSGWCFNDSSKTTSDNASLERYDEDANINPYATFNELKLVFNENPTYHKAEPDSDDDSVSLEKAEAQKAMQATTDSSEDSKFVQNVRIPHKPRGAEQHSYDNQAVVLSPRKYASADQIHALFTMAPPRPQSAYSKNRSQGTRSTPSEKGSQRHSLISSVTTVSSSRDELMEAFENLNRNPPQPPVVYETEADSLSQPTDSSSTEPGICLFTESPPQPNERREASCEVPRYESPDECQYKEPQTAESKPADNPESRTPPRRSGRGSSVQKNKEAIYRGTGVSRTTTRPRCIEEVTYMFSGEESPSRARKPQSFEEKLRCTREDSGSSVWRRVYLPGGRRTPHARTRYDTTLQTPGAADNKPLVSAQELNSKEDSPEDDESVSLLNRYYRPVPARRSGDVLMLEDDEENEYTENFTVV